MVYTLEGVGKEVLADAVGTNQCHGSTSSVYRRWLSGDYLKIELCAACGISRPTADKWIKRYEQSGVKALEERSRAPHSHANATTEQIRKMI